MAIPKYNEMYSSILDLLKDGAPHTIGEIKEYVANAMCITDSDRKERLPSGKSTVFNNRVGWARTYLNKAGLLNSHSRGVWTISSEGKRLILEEPHLKIDNDYLMRYDSFRDFRTRGNTDENIDIVEMSTDTPQDQMDDAYRRIVTALAADLLDEVMAQPPDFFEQLVVQLLVKMGYGGSLEGAGTVLGKSGDEGIDGVIREDKLGFSHIYIQAKRWGLEQTVGRPEIQKFVGALAGQGATRGLFITTATFTKEAYSYAEKQHTTKVVLVDGKTLAKLMIDHGLGVATQMTYELKKIDTDFFNSDMDI